MTGKRNLPEGWQIKEFKNCIINKNVNTPKIPETKYLKEGEYPIVDQSSNLVAGYTNDETLVYRHENPVIVFGDHTRIFKYVDFDFAIGADGTKTIHPNSDTVNPKCFYFVLKQADFHNDGYNRHYKYVKTLKLPLPSDLNDQATIANELEYKMAEVEKIRQAVIRQKEATTAMEGAILREVFPYKEGDKLPEGWKWETLLDICFVNPSKGKDFFREPNAQTTFVPMEAVDELTGRITKRITRPYSEISKGYTFFKEGDVLFAKITPCMQNGKSAIAHNLIDGIGFGSTEFHILRPKQEIKKEWVYYFIRTEEFRKRAEVHFEGSAGQQRVPKDFIERTFIPLPPTPDDQIRITNKLESKIAEIAKIRQAADKQLKVVEALPWAILREIFDFEEEQK